MFGVYILFEGLRQCIMMIIIYKIMRQVTANLSILFSDFKIGSM